MRRGRILSGVVILVAALTAGPAAAQSPDASPGSSLGPPASLPAVGVPFCQDVPDIVIPADRFRDTPVYIGNEQPTDELRRWGQRQPRFQDLWVDRDHLGWVVLAFGDDAEARQADLEREFPGVGAVAVEVPWTTSRPRCPPAARLRDG